MPSPVTLCGHTLDRPEHVCAFFDSRDERYELLTPFYREGIEQGERVINIVDRDEEAEHLSRLRGSGIDVNDAIEKGRLRVFASEDTYTLGGRFAAGRMYDTLQSALAEAQRAGHRARGAGVMEWSARGYPGTEELMEYEARVNVLVPIYGCTLLCVYDLNRMSGRLAMDVLRTHSMVIDRGELVENPYYRPPLEMLRSLRAMGRPAEDQPQA